MQAQVPQTRPLNLAMLQHAPVEHVDQDERDTKFDTDNSLTGDPEQDQLLLGIIISLVQLLMRQFGDHQQQSGNSDNDGSSEQQEATDNNTNDSNNRTGNSDFSNQFSSRDKGLLLNAIGTKPESGTTINGINDSNSSGHLNSGDNLQLQVQDNAETHTLTNPEVSSFITARNPPNTPKLKLTAQQASALENSLSLEKVSIADTSGNQNVDVGDILTGTQTRDGKKIRVDMPVDQAMLELINSNSSGQQTAGTTTLPTGGGNGLLGN